MGSLLNRRASGGRRPWPPAAAMGDSEREEVAVIERMGEMPEGTIGLRAVGELTRDDYVEVLEPALREALSAGAIRLVFMLTDFSGLAPGAWVEDVKTGLRTWIRDHAAWRRFAFVTDIDWLTSAMHAFAWMAPGEVETFRVAQLDAAKRWAAGVP
jgi:hypothetical protein